MKLFRVLVLAVALVAGGLAAYLALNIGSPPEQATAVLEPVPQIKTQQVLVTNANIGQGQTLTAENIRWQEWPEAAITEGYIQQQAQPEALSELAGSIVRSPFIAGEPVRLVKLARPESGYLSAILPSGKRAVAVRVSAQTTAGGFILPNDRVDVIQTIAEQQSPDGPSANVSRTILRNVKVLAIDQQVEEQADAAVVVGKTATLELEPEQSELITAAEASGTLSLALRSAADTDEVTAAIEERKTGTVEVYRFGRKATVSTQ